MRALIYSAAIGAALGLALAGFWQLDEQHPIAAKIVVAILAAAGLAYSLASSKPSRNSNGR